MDFVEEYPMTASGKIQKYKLRETAIERYGLREAAEWDPEQGDSGQQVGHGTATMTLTR